MSQDWRPWQIALLACVLAFVTARVLAWAGRVRVAVRDRGVLQTVFDGLKSLPIVNGIVRDQQEKLVVCSAVSDLRAVYLWWRVGALKFCCVKCCHWHHLGLRKVRFLERAACCRCAGLSNSVICIAC